MVYLIEAFEFGRIDWVCIWEDELEGDFAVAVRGFRLRRDSDVDSLEGVLLWEGQLHEFDGLLRVGLDVSLKTKSSHVLLGLLGSLNCLLLVGFDSFYHFAFKLL